MRKFLLITFFLFSFSLVFRVEKAFAAYCGNLWCEAGEDCYSCSADCGTCGGGVIPPPASSCTLGVCDELAGCNCYENPLICGTCDGWSWCSDGVCPDSRPFSTYCTPDCSDPNRDCYDTPSCSTTPINCNDVGGDAYCQSVVHSGSCGDPACVAVGICAAGGNCWTDCSGCSTQPQHWTCSGCSCILVDGLAENECSIASDCGCADYHYSCSGSTCARVSGSGISGCTRSSDCTTICGYITNSDGYAIPNYSVQVYNNDPPHTVDVTTGNNGKFNTGTGFVSSGDFYAVRAWSSPPADYSPPAKSTTSGWTWDYARVPKSDTPLGSTSYEGQLFGTNDCANDYDSQGKCRCSFMFERATPPELVSFAIANSNNTLVAADGLGRNHICEDAFRTTGVDSRKVKFEVTMSDVDGADDITSITLRFRNGSTDYLFANATGLQAGGSPSWNLSGLGSLTASLVAGQQFVSNPSSNQKRVVFTIEFPTNFYNGSFYLFDLGGYAVDVSNLNSGAYPDGRDFRVWDCQVPVSGSLYDGSDSAEVCPAAGLFTTKIGAEVNFRTLSYGLLGMTPSLPSDYSDGGNTLTWGVTYVPQFNADFNGSDPRLQIKITDVAIGDTACDSGEISIGSPLFDPYISPVAQIDFSVVANQSPWYQASNMSIQSKLSLSHSIPVTCVVDGPCISALTIDDRGYDGNGFCVSSVLSSSSGCGETEGCLWGYDNDWYRAYNPNFILVDYESMYRDLYESKGEGVVYESVTSWSQIMSDVGGTGLIFYNGNLTINSTNTVDSGEFLLVVVNGDITINTDINEVAGAFLTDGDFSASGNDDDQLVISGMIYAVGSVTLDRGFETAGNNNTIPGVSVVYRPDIIFNAPSYMFTTISRL